MERLLAHPATAPLVHVNHSHRATLPSRPTAATGTKVDEPPTGRFDLEPWRFEIGTMPLNQGAPDTNIYSYAACYTARNMEAIKRVVNAYLREHPKEYSVPLSSIADECHFYLDEQDDMGRSSPYFVKAPQEDEMGISKHKFTRASMGDGPLFIKEPGRMYAREVLGMPLAPLIMFREVYLNGRLY
jgi:hypothetical protein